MVEGHCEEIEHLARNSTIERFKTERLVLVCATTATLGMPNIDVEMVEEFERSKIYFCWIWIEVV